MKLAAAIFFTFFVLCLTVPARAGIVYFNDFSSTPGAEWSSTSTRASNGESYLASTSGYGFGNGTVTLTLTGLTVGASATIDFDLYVIGSWDGNGVPGNNPSYPDWARPDNWGVTVNGITQIYTNFVHYTYNGQTQAYPSMLAPLGSGGSNPARTGATATDHLGYGTGYYGDTTYHFSIPVGNLTSSTLTVAFTSYQTEGYSNEGWGLDNVKVTSSVPTPIPASLLLFAPGLLGLATFRRRFDKRR
ncbi:MAG: hypothetical protein A4E66_00815 [Syntrophus sp. PtaB.Bin001]|nr:MAG: hypothetical protein A4E66_00815 [Syntrophus sp. PtaB.Bin001]